MVFNRYSAGILILILLISLTGSAFLWSLDKSWLVISSYSFALALALEIFYLYYYLHRTQRALQLFLESAKYLDNFNDSMAPDISISKFNLSYNEVLDLVRKSRLDKELEHLYFRNTIEHLNTGILTYDANGKIEIINKVAIDLLQIINPRFITQLEKSMPGLESEIKSMKPGQNRLFSCYRKGETLLLTLRCSDFILSGRPVRLLSLQNIKQEIEGEEIAAWQKLIRVLTHEIMNSVSPIKSLTHTLTSLFEKDGVALKAEDLNDETMSKCLTGLKAIENRSKGLLSFVENYRSLTRIPEPLMNEINIIHWLENIITLMKDQLDSSGIKYRLKIVPSDLKVWGDEKLLSQVMINLIKNSIEAFTGKKERRIEIIASSSETGSVSIEVLDNGKGIKKEELDIIFIPFFSTKEAGSGIGLSLARQIMRLHGGSLRAYSGADFTRFVLGFR